VAHNVKATKVSTDDNKDDQNSKRPILRPAQSEADQIDIK